MRTLNFHSVWRHICTLSVYFSSIHWSIHGVSNMNITFSHQDAVGEILTSNPFKKPNVCTILISRSNRFSLMRFSTLALFVSVTTAITVTFFQQMHWGIGIPCASWQTTYLIDRLSQSKIKVFQNLSQMVYLSDSLSKSMHENLYFWVLLIVKKTCYLTKHYAMLHSPHKPEVHNCLHHNCEDIGLCDDVRTDFVTSADSAHPRTYGVA